MRAQDGPDRLVGQPTGQPLDSPLEHTEPDQDPDVVEARPVLRKLRVQVDGMTCRHCVRDVTARLRDVNGVETVSADATSGLVVLTGTMSGKDVLAALAGLSYDARLMEHD
jgi:copper chaperone CopZ